MRDLRECQSHDADSSVRSSSRLQVKERFSFWNFATIYTILYYIFRFDHRRCFVKTIQMAVSQRLLPLRCVICRAKILRLKQTLIPRDVSSANNQHSFFQSPLLFFSPSRNDALRLTCDLLLDFLPPFFHRCKKKKLENARERKKRGIRARRCTIAHECKIVVNWSELGNHSSPWLRGRIARHDYFRNGFNKYRQSRN